MGSGGGYSVETGVPAAPTAAGPISEWTDAR